MVSNVGHIESQLLGFLATASSVAECWNTVSQHCSLLDTSMAWTPAALFTPKALQKPLTH